MIVWDEQLRGQVNTRRSWAFDFLVLAPSHLRVGRLCLPTALPTDASPHARGQMKPAHPTQLTKIQTQQLKQPRPMRRAYVRRMLNSRRQ
jgi:hypothetical protein